MRLDFPVRPMLGRNVRASFFALATGFALASAASAQELPVKRGPALTGSGHCLAADRPALPAPPQARDAARLAGEATRAALVGDEATALDLLRRATELDPSAAAIAYRFARVLEDTGQREAALRHYCRYLELAGNTPAAAEVQSRITALAPPSAATPDPQVVEAFRAGVQLLEAGDPRAAIASFNSVIVAEPSWADAYYNRALALADAGAPEQAANDLNAYLRLAPRAHDRAIVLAQIQRLRPSSGPAPASVLMAGLALPGASQMATGRPVMGLGVLAGAGGAVAAGLLTRRVEVRCLTQPEDGICPPDDVLERQVDRPYLIPATIGAAVFTALAAWEGYRAARDRRAAPDVSAPRRSATAVHRQLLPAFTTDGSGLHFEWTFKF